MQVAGTTRFDNASPAPVLWLCGPPGVGKTTVGWRIFEDLVGGGVRTGYVDIDQLGICYPDPPDDPDRHRLMARNLGAVAETFRLAGARCVVVSGVVDPQVGVRLDEISNGTVTAVRLRAERDDLRARFLGRGTPGEVVDEVLQEADAYDRGNVGLCVDTSGRSFEEVVRMVRDRIGGWPDVVTGRSEDAGPERGLVAGDTSGPVMWLCGATGVGKSTVGWQIWMQTQRRRMVSGFVDLGQIGFLRPAPVDDPHNHRVKARNLAALWSNFRSCGAQSLTVVGPVDDHDAVQIYRDALPGAGLTLTRLHAGRDALTERILARGRGGGPQIPGDELVGQSERTLLRVAETAAANAGAMERAALGDLCVDTGGRTADEVVGAVLARAGNWPDSGPGPGLPRR